MLGVAPRARHPIGCPATEAAAHEQAPRRAPDLGVTRARGSCLGGRLGRKFRGRWRRRRHGMRSSARSPNSRGNVGARPRLNTRDQSECRLVSSYDRHRGAAQPNSGSECPLHRFFHRTCRGPELASIRAFRLGNLSVDPKTGHWADTRPDIPLIAFRRAFCGARRPMLAGPQRRDSLEAERGPVGAIARGCARRYPAALRLRGWNSDSPSQFHSLRNPLDN